MVHYLFLRGGGYHTYQKMPETFQPELSLGRGGMNTFGKATDVVDAVPLGQVIHILADGMVGEIEIGVDQVLHVLDAARITGFIQLHPDAVTDHVIQHDEILFTLLRHSMRCFIWL